MIRVHLCAVSMTDIMGAQDTLVPVHVFDRESPIPTGTTFQWMGRDYVHAYDIRKDDGFDIIYVEQRIEIVQ